MEFYRGIIVSQSGQSPAFPSLPLNLITSWMDGSQVYGSDNVTASALRAWKDGLLRSNPNNSDFPPFNDNTTGVLMQTASITDQSKLLLVGDARGNENPGLLALQILFFREHNRRARLLKQKNPTWTDEELYQEARKMVIAVMHHITEEEYIPITLGEHLPEFSTLNLNLEPSVAVEFSTGAFRYGHSEVNTFFLLPPSQDRILLREAYFNPLSVIENYDNVLRGMWSQKQSAVDLEIVDDLRNFLFGSPGAGGLDLVSINTQRGRDHGLPGINAFRLTYGLPKYEKWSDITPDTQVQNLLKSVYDSIEDCDVYVCGLAEPPFKAANVGETFYIAIKEQYLRTRDGDSAWYETPNYLTEEEEQEARSMFLSDVIIRNTNNEQGTVPCQVMAMPDGCGLAVNSEQQGGDVQYDFVVTIVDNGHNSGDDSEENRFTFAVNGVNRGNVTVHRGRTYTFLAQVSCAHAITITTTSEPLAALYEFGVDNQYACMHAASQVLTLKVDEATPSQLYYQCGLHFYMGGTINVIGGNPPSSDNGSVVGLSVVVGILSVILIAVIIHVAIAKGRKKTEEGVHLIPKGTEQPV